MWDVRVGRFVYSREDDPSTGNRTTPSRFDQRDGCLERRSANLRRIDASFARPPRRRSATTGPGCWAPITSGRWAGSSNGASTTSLDVIPTGVRFVDNNGQPFQAISRAPSQRRRCLPHGLRVRERRHHGGGPADDQRRTAVRPQPRHQSRTCTRSIPKGAKPTRSSSGLGTLYTWNVLSPRLGVTSEAHRRWPHDAARELRAVQPGRADRRVRRDSTPVRPRPRRPRSIRRPAATRRIVKVVDPRINLQLDPETRAPRTDEYSIGVDREVGRRLAVAIAYVRKNGEQLHRMDGCRRSVSRGVADVARRPQRAGVRARQLHRPHRRFLLTNPEGYSLTYNGLVMAVEKRRSDGWQAFGSYTFSRVSGLQASSGSAAAGAQVSSVAGATQLTFGRIPTISPTRAAGCRTIARTCSASWARVDVPRTGLVVAANLQYFSGKPWAASAQLTLPQGSQRVLLEPRGSRRLSSQSLLDLRVSRTIRLRRRGTHRAAPGRAQCAQ